MQRSTQHAASRRRQVNTGKHQDAIEYFDKLLATHPTLLAALLGRGTANALRGKLVEAVGDFTKVPSSPSSSSRAPTPHHRHDFTTAMTPTPPEPALCHTHTHSHTLEDDGCGLRDSACHRAGDRVGATDLRRVEAPRPNPRRPRPRRCAPPLSIPSMPSIPPPLAEWCTIRRVAMPTPWPRPWATALPPRSHDAHQ
jgi:hypothetical protein